MVTLIHDGLSVSVPGWVSDIDAFRRWTDADDFPKQGRVWWLKGEVWIDMNKEQIFSHVLVKTEFTMVLALLAKQNTIGLYLTDGVLLSNFAADISGNPDGLFLSADTLNSDRIRLIEGRVGGYTELQGSPDMVLEILSDSSVTKDNVTLMQAYWDAEIREYWLVDARKDPISFDIYRHTTRGYVRTRGKQGWLTSTVFGRAFRFGVQSGMAGHPQYSLEVR